MAERFESDCVIILRYLDEEEYSGLKDMEDWTGVSKDELRRYLLPEVKEKRKVSKLEQWQEKNPRLFAKVIENAVYIGEVGGKEMVQIDTSKHEYLLHYARKYNYRIVDIEDYPYITAIKKSKIEQKENFSKLAEEGKDIGDSDDGSQFSSSGGGDFSPLL